MAHITTQIQSFGLHVTIAFHPQIISGSHGMCLLCSETLQGGFLVFNIPSIRKASSATIPNLAKVQFSRLYFLHDSILSKPCAMAQTGVFLSVG